MILAKQPAETLPWSPFAGLAVTALVSCTASARGIVAGALALTLDPGAAATDPILVSGGSDGESYLVTAIADSAGGERIERELEVAVIDATWTMPDGGASYLSIAEFVKRFGLAETLVMTGSGNGRIDRDYLIGALQAAQGVVDLNVAARYQVPLAIVPEAIKTAIGDLARARLYPNGAPEGVATLAKSAERTLERIASGALPLPLPAGEAAAPATASPTPVLISPRGRRAYPNGLDDFR